VNYSKTASGRTMKYHPILQLAIGILLSFFAWAEDSNPSTCVFDDGQEYQAGESVGDSFVTRCGDSSEWPCFCDPQLTFQAFCPYCGFSDMDGTLHCARDGETISYQDGSITRVCSCALDPDDPAAEPMRNCTVEGGDGSPDETPTFDGQCTLPDAEGNLVEIDNGESFGDLIEGACGPASIWPSYCRVLDEDGNFDFLYPYCVFDDVSLEDSETGSLCAMDGDVIEFTDENNVPQSCNCTISEDGTAQPECDNLAPVPSTPTDFPSFTPDIQATPMPTAGAFSIRSLSLGWIVPGVLQIMVGLQLLR
jgi:hypothetical protein